jgi:hypothetical protein
MKEVRPSEKALFYSLVNISNIKLRLIRPIKMPCQSLIQEKFKTDQHSHSNNATVVPIQN